MQTIHKDQMENHENVEQYSDEYYDQIIPEDYSESIQPLSQEEQLRGLPALWKYMLNNHQIFTPENLNLDELVFWKSQPNIEELQRAMKSYFSEERNKSSINLGRRKPRNEVASEYMLNFSKLPYYETYFLSITEIEENRFNMFVKNQRGEIISFFAKQRKVKKVSKILKLFCGIKKPAFAVIVDRTTQDALHVDHVAKISEFITEFIYVYEAVPSDVLKTYQNRLEQNKLHDLKYNYLVETHGNELIISSEHIGSVLEGEIYDTVIGRLRRQDEEENEVLRSMRGEFETKDRNLYFDLILLNFWRALNCCPEKCLDIILEILQKKEEKVKEKEVLDNSKKIEMEIEEENNDPNCHFPGTMLENKLCKRCEIVRKRRLKKTKYRCIGCSVTYKYDIALCPDCFVDFHTRIDSFGPRMLLEKKNCNRIAPRKRIGREKAISKEIHSEEEEKPFEKEPCREVKEDPNELKVQLIPEIVHEIINPQEKIVEPFEEEEINPEVQEKIVKLDEKMTETFSLVKQLGEKGHYDVAGVFLGILLNSTLTRMKLISTKFPEMNTGLTKIGSDVYDIAKTNQENETNRLKVPNIVQLLQKAEKLRMFMSEESPQYLKEEHQSKNENKF